MVSGGREGEGAGTDRAKRTGDWKSENVTRFTASLDCCFFGGVVSERRKQGKGGRTSSERSEMREWR